MVISDSIYYIPLFRRFHFCRVCSLPVHYRFRPRGNGTNGDDRSAGICRNSSSVETVLSASRLARDNRKSRKRGPALRLGVTRGLSGRTQPPYRLSLPHTRFAHLPPPFHFSLSISRPFSLPLSLRSSFSSFTPQSFPFHFLFFHVYFFIIIVCTFLLYLSSCFLLLFLFFCLFFLFKSSIDRQVIDVTIYLSCDNFPRLIRTLFSLHLPSPISRARGSQRASPRYSNVRRESVGVRGSGKTRSAFVSPAVETLSAGLKKYNGFSPREDNERSKVVTRWIESFFFFFFILWKNRCCTFIRFYG